jgi:pre-60S factor REI1
MSEQKKEDTKEEKQEVNESMNKSMRTNMMCNHCLYVSKTYEEMKEHYKSEFHKYNLNRVTMNLAPLSFEDYKRKKEFFMKKAEEKKKLEETLKVQSANLYCDICNKKFNSRKKLDEHLASKTHLKNKAHKEEIKKEDEKKEENNEISTSSKENKKTEPEKTTLDDVTICLFCNEKNENLKENMYHMVQKHKLDIPFVLYIKSYTDLLKLLAKKIFSYHACLTCDTQKFESIRSLQNHMLAKSHTSINDKDLDEFLFKYYDLKKLLSIKEKSIRRTKEFKILSLRARVAKELKEKNLDGDDEWEEVKSNEGDDDYEPMTLPNGELLLEDGTTLGNKEYKVYYKQRFHINKYEGLQKAHKERNKERNLRLKRRDQLRKNVKRHVNYKVLKGSNKANFSRINKLTVKRPQIALV